MSTDAEPTASIRVMANGPYVVSGGVPLRSKTPIVSENGEPMAWLTGPVTDRGAGYALCRCGGSANKPYCDGTHSSNGFDGTESASTQSYAQSSTELGGTGLTIRDDRSLCEHAGFCGNRVTNVWDMAAETGDSVVRAQAMAMIERCPSGALTYEVDGQAVEPSLPVEIATVPDGPLYVTGSIAVQRADRQGFEARNRMTLCRCGASKNKPLCDGSHADAGFQAP